MLRKTSIAVFVLVCLCSLGAARTAEACTARPPQPPVIHVIFHEICCAWNNPGRCYIRAWIIVRNYNIVQGGKFCGCAFNKVGPIVAVDRFQITEAGTDIPIAGFCFDDNSAVAESAGSFISGNFTGFQGPFPGSASGAVDLHFDVRLREGSTFDELKEALSSNGAIVTGEVNPDGSFDNPDHMDIVTEFGEITDESGTCSSLSATTQKEAVPGSLLAPVATSPRRPITGGEGPTAEPSDCPIKITHGG